jgi:ankyrin repeat protein
MGAESSVLNKELEDAVSNADTEKIRNLIKRGAKVNNRNEANGYVPLHKAALLRLDNISQKQKEEVIQVLLDAKTDVNILTNNKRTPLWLCGNSRENFSKSFFQLNVEILIP